MPHTRLHTFGLLTAEQIANSPSRRDGMTAAAEAKTWKKMGVVIFETAKAVQPTM